MKKIYIYTFLLMASLCAKATIHTVLVADFNFIPASVNAVCGDTVAWVWSSGTHTTTSTSVPACATPWNAPITTTQSTFAIVIPCEGTYNYNCTVHPSMTANIIATCATGIKEQTLSASLLSPNPFTESVSVTYQNKDRIVIYNMLGKAMREFSLIPGSTMVQLDLEGLPSGIYFLGLFSKGILTESRKISKQ